MCARGPQQEAISQISGAESTEPMSRRPNCSRTCHLHFGIHGSLASGRSHGPSILLSHHAEPVIRSQNESSRSENSPIMQETRRHILQAEMSQFLDSDAVTASDTSPSCLRHLSTA